MSEYILELEGYGVAFGEKIILSSVDMKVPTKGNVVLLGPAGIGKSTLLRSICGINYANPSFRTWGTALYAGSPITEDTSGPSLVSQNAKLMMSTIFENIVHGLPERHTLQKNQQIEIVERLLQRAGLEHLKDNLDESVIDLPLGIQRHLAILRTSASNPKLLCIDEPTTGLEEQHVDSLLRYISEESERRAIITILHNQIHAKRLQGMVALLAGGWIHEFSANDKFYTDPASKAGKQFVKSGSCAVVGPEYDEEALQYLEKDSVELPPPLPEAAKSYVSDALGPRNFLWLKKGMLAGTPQPGLVTDLDYDLQALKRVGITKLITLLEKPLDPEPMKPYGIENLWFAIDDMKAPDPELAMQWCDRVEQYMRNGEVVAYHCKAGLGRTGTMLAAQLIWEGFDAYDALEKARRIEPRWVQSDEQVEFLQDFEKIVLQNRNGFHSLRESKAL